jgi:hypothetical protein
MKSTADTKDERLGIMSAQSYAKQAEVCGLCHKIRMDQDGN